MNGIPEQVKCSWKLLSKDYEYICHQQSSAKAKNNINHLGTLGTGNHFIEVCQCYPFIKCCFLVIFNVIDQRRRLQED